MFIEMTICRSEIIRLFVSRYKHHNDIRKAANISRHANDVCAIANREQVPVYYPVLLLMYHQYKYAYTADSKCDYW